VVPANVAYAVNFYQTRGLLHGRSRITAADPAETEILGDFFRNYNKPPAECSKYPWLTRHLFPGHTAIECDPQVWSQVEGLIENYSFAAETASVLHGVGGSHAAHYQSAETPAADGNKPRPVVE